MSEQLSFQQRLEERVKRITTPVSDDLWRYREAAAVLASFNYESLHALGDVSPSSTAKTELLADCDVVYAPGGAINLLLRTAIRQAALHRLLADKRVEVALESNPKRPDTPEQRVLERYLTGLRTGRTSLGAVVRSPEEGEALLGVIDWLSGVPEFEGRLPNIDLVKQRIAREQLLQPFKDLVGDTFAGRRAELVKLEDYVGVHDASSTIEAVKRYFSIHDRPPLFVNGPGGCGKSTLIAKFILNHTRIEESSRFPFAYLDFDRVGLVAEEPITLLADIMRQLAIQFPASSEAHRKIASEWSAEFSKRLTPADQPGFRGDSARRIRKEEREFFLSQFADFVNGLKVENAPLLLVLDTFEEVQFRSAAFADEVLDFLNDLQSRIPNLRSVLSGRNDIVSTQYKVNVVPIGNFDRDAAVSYLGVRGVKDEAIASTIFDQVGGSPLVLRLAADVAQIEKVDASGISGLSRWFSIFSKQSIEVVLYKRILDHVKDKRVAELAYPGLVLRQVTARILREVLAPACEVTIASDAEANELVRTMRNQLSTILVPSNEDQEILIHRTDMRAILLRDVNEKALKDTKFADKLKKTHDAAIKFYSQFNDAANRAEEIYHRLSLSVDRKVLASRWMDGIEPFFGSSIRELPPQSQIYLAARVEFELPEGSWADANDEDWVLYASRVAHQQLGLQKPLEALKLLEQRMQLWGTEVLAPVLDEVLRSVFVAYANEYEQIRKTDAGDARTITMNSLVWRIGATAKGVRRDPQYARTLFSEGREGIRLVAIAIAAADPAATHFDMAVEAIRKSYSPFEQYHALRLANSTFGYSTPTQRAALREALISQEGTPIHKTDLSRQTIKNELLKMLAKAPVFSLDVVRGGASDCLLLHYGSSENPHLIIVDGGGRGVYASRLKPRLQQIRNMRGLDNTPLNVDLIVVSHSDKDHMQGILDLTNELVVNKTESVQPPLKVLGFWHNSLEDILGRPLPELTANFVRQFGTRLSDEPFADSIIDADAQNREALISSFKMLSGIQEGHQLRANLSSLAVPVNGQFAGKLILAGPKSKPILLQDGVKITVIGPLRRDLEDLHQRQKHGERLTKLVSGGKFDELLAGYVDMAVPDVSSISLLLEVEKKRMLLTGNVRTDKILEGLEMRGLIKSGETLQLDLMTVPGGGAMNLNYDFFKRIVADHYVFSGNGEDGNPDRESLEMLATARSGEDYTIHFSCPPEEIDAVQKHEWDQAESRQKRKQQKMSYKLRHDWDPERQSLAAFLHQRADFVNKVSVISDDQPYMINLLDVLTQ